MLSLLDTLDHLHTASFGVNQHKGIILKNSPLNFFKAQQSSTAHNKMLTETIDLQDNIDSFIFLKKWGEDYPAFLMSKKAKKNL